MLLCHFLLPTVRISFIEFCHHHLYYSINHYPHAPRANHFTERDKKETDRAIFFTFNPFSVIYHER